VDAVRQFLGNRLEVFHNVNPGHETVANTQDHDDVGLAPEDRKRTLLSRQNAESGDASAAFDPASGIMTIIGGFSVRPLGELVKSLDPSVLGKVLAPAPGST
jgi:hypothetical protein